MVYANAAVLASGADFVREDGTPEIAVSTHFSGKTNYMGREIIPNSVSDFVIWAQKGKCLLCSYPLTLCCHLHHIIPHSQRGPDLPLNLAGLCVNHHILIETVKKWKWISAYKIGHRTTDLKNLRNSELVSHLQTFDENQTKIFNLLAEKHQRTTSIEGIEPRIQLGVAHIIVENETKFLNSLNRLRPRIFFWRRDSRVPGGPYDIVSINDEDLQREIDQTIAERLGEITDEIYDGVLTELLMSIGFRSFVSVGGIKFIFPKGFYSVREIRKLPGEEVYG